MNQEIIEDREILYRAERTRDPSSYINGKPGAPLFMQAGGCSVERDGRRSEKEIIGILDERFSDYKCAVKLTALQCRDLNTFPTPCKNKKNKFHAEIWDSPENIEIPLDKAMQLARICTVVT